LGFPQLAGAAQQAWRKFRENGAETFSLTSRPKNPICPQGRRFGGFFDFSGTGDAYNERFGALRDFFPRSPEL
jgi:hypothetical protein